MEITQLPYLSTRDLNCVICDTVPRKRATLGQIVIIGCFKFAWMIFPLPVTFYIYNSLQSCQQMYEANVAGLRATEINQRRSKIPHLMLSENLV